jgi:hypothetical protein
MTRRRVTVATLAAAAAVAVISAAAWAVSGDSGDEPPAGGERRAAGSDSPIQPARWDGEGVPPVTLHLSTRTVTLDPWAYCYDTACVDGIQPEHPEEVGSPDLVRFSFPEPGWTFEARFTEVGSDCPRTITVPATSTGPKTFELEPAGPAGTWDVDLFGRGDGGDVITTFRWRTPRAGTLPEPDAYLGIVSTTGGDTHVYAPELAINDLASTPENATAVITVTAADGASRTLPELRPTRGCTSVGNLFFNGPDDMRAGLADLGPLPYTYTVDLTMDGTTYTGAAVYPDDEIEGSEPYASLTFDPPLPAYTG